MARALFSLLSLSAADGFTAVSRFTQRRATNGLASSSEDSPKEVSFGIKETTAASDLAVATSFVKAPEPFDPTPALLSFDPVGVFIQHREPMGMHFREVLLKYSGLRLPRPDIFHDVFKKVYEAKCEESPNFGGADTDSADWWRSVVEGTYLEVGVPKDLLDPLMPDVFPELHEQVFTGTEGWELCDDAEYILGQIADYQQKLGAKAPKVVAVSDFDDRLSPLLEALGIRRFFDAVVTSKECGAAKPAPSVFDAALAKLALDDAKVAVHVGASFDADVAGASAAGWQAVFVKGPPYSTLEPNPTNAEYRRIGDPLRVLDLLGIESDDFRPIRTSTTRGIYGQDYDDPGDWEGYTDPVDLGLPP